MWKILGQIFSLYLLNKIFLKDFNYSVISAISTWKSFENDFTIKRFSYEYQGARAISNQ